jgi:hypothetical protein
VTATPVASGSTTQSDGGGDGKSFTTPAGPTFQSGDRLLVFVGSSSNADTIAAPGTGTWTEVDPTGDKVVTTSGGQLRAFEGAGIAASTAYAFTLSGGRRSLGWLLLRDTDSGATIVDVASSLESAAGATHAPPSVVPTASAELAVDCIMFRQFNPDTSTCSPPASGLTWTEQLDFRGADSNNNVQIAVNTATAGSSGVAVSTAPLNTDDPFEPALVMRVLIKSAAGGATNLNVGGAAATVAAANVGVSAALAAGPGAVAAAAASVTLNARPAAGSGAVAAAAANATLTPRPAPGSAAVGAAAAGVTMSARPAAAAAAAGLAAGGITLAAAAGVAGAAVGVGAGDITLTTSGATSLTVGNAMISVGAFDIRLEGGSIVAAETGSWNGLLAILNDIRQETAQQLAMPPTACPRCGEPLEAARGVLHCRFDGWTDGDVAL